jgi:hypothetical protein
VTNTLQEVWRLAKILAEHQRGGSSSPLLDVKKACALWRAKPSMPDGAADSPPTLTEQLFDAVNESSDDKGFDQVFDVMLG